MDLISYSLAKRVVDLVDGKELRVSDMEIVDGDLLVTLSSGKTVNAGTIPATNSEELEEINKQIEEIKKSSISIEGGTLVGNLTLSTPPIDDFHAVNKQYVDNKIINKNESKDFPETGLPDVIYKAEKEKKLYQWNSISQTYEVLNESHTNQLNYLIDSLTLRVVNIEENYLIKTDKAELLQDIAIIEQDVNKNIDDIALLQKMLIEKANSSEVYTKDEIGIIEENETIISMIDKIKTEISHNDSQIYALILEETARASQAEEKNSTEITRINNLLENILDNNSSELDSIKELATWINSHGSVTNDLIIQISNNTKAIENLANNLPNAIQKEMVKADNVTIENKDGVFSVKNVSTDMLTQGTMVIVLNGGTANSF